ncbi:MAG: hypothetical protein M1514_02720 [Patescibacteria group bacterium]|nr:hypothetical protein [Patescibacteria group bacterium]
MKKEVLLSILIGFGIGLIATFGLYNARKSIQTANQIESPLADNSSSPTSTPVSPALSLISPMDESLVNDSKITLSGICPPSSWVAIITEKGEKIIQADKKGNFETEVNLVSGENEIEVNSVSENGDTITKTITVVYSTVEI